MIHSIFKKLFSILLCLCCASMFFAADILIQGGFSNETFNPISGVKGDITIPYIINIEQALSQDMAISFSIKPFSILPQIVSASFMYRTSAFTIQGGPILAFGDMSLLLEHIGFNLALSWQAPGIALAHIATDILFNPIQSTATAMHYRQNLHIKAGVYFPNVILSFIFEQNKLHTSDNNEAILFDRYSYGIEADTFKKGVPWRFTLNMGYIHNMRTKADDQQKTIEFDEASAGIKVTYDTYNNLLYTVALHAPLITIPITNQVQSKSNIAFSITVGVQFKL